MSECVVRMEMPHDGLCDLAFSFLDRTCCTIEGNLCNYCDDGVIPKWCPIICSLPEGHGRLVDARAFIEHVYDEWQKGVISNSEWCNIRQWVNDAPTIVPAERRANDGTD